MIALDLPLPGVGAWLARGDRDIARLALLDDRERHRAARLPDAAAVRYIAARCTIRRIVARQIGTHDAFSFKYVSGRPILPDHPHIHISISYSGDWCAVALADRRVGIDVEQVVPGSADGQPYGGNAFYTRWTLAEASFKARCDGLPFDTNAGMPHPPAPLDRGIMCLSIPSAISSLALALAAAD